MPLAMWQMLHGMRHDAGAISVGVERQAGEHAEVNGVANAKSRLSVWICTVSAL